MAKEKTPEGKKPFDLSHASTTALRGRQSVRATFKLTEGCIDALSIVAAHLGIKQKSLFDHLIDDIASLNSIAREVRNDMLLRKDRVQKTFVISRKTLSSLEEVSRAFNAPRDALVEYSVLKLIPIIASEREKHEKRKEILKEVKKHLDEGLKLFRKMQANLEEDDPVCGRMASVMATYANAFESISAFIEKGSIIEDFDAEAMVKGD
jgi:hypothetical protein